MIGRKRLEEEHLRKVFGLANGKSLAITIPKRMTKELDWNKGDTLSVKEIKGGEKLEYGDVIIRKIK